MPTTHIRPISSDNIPSWLICNQSHACERFQSGECQGQPGIFTSCELYNSSLPTCSLCNEREYCNRLRDSSLDPSTAICGNYYTHICHFCGSHNGQYRLTVGSNIYIACNECYNRRHCRECSSTSFNVIASREGYCNNCAIPCPRCNTNIMSRHQEMCQSCYNSLPICQECGDRITEYNQTDVERVCSSCVCQYCNSYHPGRYCTFAIRDYSYEPEWQFLHAPGELQNGTLRYFGIELETECFNNRHDAMQSIASHERGESFVRWAIPSSDGSLHNGIEFKCHPMTLNFAKSFWESNIDVLDDEFTIQSSCGMHTSVGYDTLNSNQWVKLCVLWYSDDFQHRFQKIIGRGFTYYCKDKKREVDMYGTTRAYLNTEHFDAINFTGNRVEFRQFQIHTLSSDDIMKCLYFLNAVISTVKTSKARTDKIVSLFTLDKIEREYNKCAS